MASQSHPGITKSLARFSTFCSALAVGVGLLVLAGWTFHIESIKRILPGQVAVKANTGICFVLIGLALWLIRKEERKPSPAWRRVAQVFALIVSVIGLLSFLEYWYGWDIGLDQLLFTAEAEDAPGSVRPGLMPPITALGACLIGAAVALLSVEARLTRWLEHLLANIAAVASIFGILDYVLDPSTTPTHCSPITALVLLLFSIGVMVCQTDWGLGDLLSRMSSGGELARRLLPASIVVPTVIGWLRWKGQAAGFYSDWTGIAIMTVSAVTLLAGLTVWTAFVIDNTDAERQKAEQSVRRQAWIVNSSNDAIVSKTLDGVVTSWNAGAEATYGYSAEEMIGSPIGVTIPPARLDEFENLMQEIARGGQVRQYETLRIRKDRQTIHLSLSLSSLKDEGGKIVGVSTVARDITERKRAEEELRRSNTRTRFALETAKLGDWELDLTTLQASRSLLHDQIFGYQSLLPEWSFDIFLGHVHPDDRERVREDFQSCTSQGKRWEFECRIFCANGDMRWIWACGDHYRKSSGDAGRMFGIVKDITERKQAEAELRAREQHIRTLLESTAEAILGDDLEGNCTFCNPAAVRLLGYEDPDELLGNNLHAAMHHTGPDGTPLSIEDCRLAQAVREGRGFHADDLAFWRKNGTCFPAECWSHPLFDDGKVIGSVVTFFDITERRQAVEEIRRLNDELERRVIERTAQLQAANKELEAFTYSVSHDLRAPLRHISGFSKILMEDFAPGLPPDAQHHVQRIEEGTRRMGLLVDDLLNLARVGRRDLSLQVAGLKSLVEEVISGLNADFADRQVEWKIGDLPYVECDPGLMKQVFQNLLSNALKFTRPRAQAVIEVGQREENGATVIYARDNGVGFSMKYADKLFGVFQRLHRAEDFEGTGVGLATVQRIIQKHAGRIWAESELDKGAIFYFTLGVGESRTQNQAVTAGGKA